MAKPHIPDLTAIKSLPNKEIRFYAVAGAIMSLSAGLDLAYFDLFERAAKINHNTGARIFYLIRNATTRRKMANAAVSDAIAGKPLLLAEWKLLYERIAKLTGMNSRRNLLAHAVILRQMVVKEGPVIPSGFLGLTETTIDYRVEQDAALLLAGKHKPATADFDSLFSYCKEIISVLTALGAFLNKLP